MARSYRRGSRGEEVWTVQTRLKKLGLYRGVIAGTLGGETEAAVRRFQREHHFEPDGTVGPLRRALFPASADHPAPAMPQKPLEFGCLARTNLERKGGFALEVQTDFAPQLGSWSPR